ncbi:MAG: aminotransferase class V-fold PLP-dependent enzyme [Acidobacteriota bacterium]
MLRLPPDQRADLWRQVVAALEQYETSVDHWRVSPKLDPEALRSLLASCTFEMPMRPSDALSFAINGLTRHQVHTPHPRYFGLFNPAPTTMGIAADALVAAFNPQLAAWSHSPLAAEIERHLVLAFGARFGWDVASVEGTFTSGGAEANHTGLLTALHQRFPEFAESGVRALAGQPVLYGSAEGHHSVRKAARLAGLGMSALREIPVDEHLKMNCAELERRIVEDLAAGFIPFAIVATAGTTNAGVVDPLADIAAVAERYGLWFHVDAAWGGAAALVPELRPVLAGIERADSITFDAHKWLSVPMGAGIFLTRHRGALDRTFRVANAYMPREAEGLDIADPYASSMQWSRRFIGLKVFLSLMVAGWGGYAAAIRHQTAMGDLLRQRLRERGWRVVNETPLPTVCFDAPELQPGALREIATSVVESGEAWISTTQVGAGRTVLRACITNHRTQPADVEALVVSLDRARAEAPARRP